MAVAALATVVAIGFGPSTPPPIRAAEPPTEPASVVVATDEFDTNALPIVTPGPRRRSAQRWSLQPQPESRPGPGTPTIVPNGGGDRPSPPVATPRPIHVQPRKTWNALPSPRGRREADDGLEIEAGRPQPTRSEDLPDSPAVKPSTTDFDMTPAPFEVVPQPTSNERRDREDAPAKPQPLTVTSPFELEPEAIPEAGNAFEPEPATDPVVEPKPIDAVVDPFGEDSATRPLDDEPTDDSELELPITRPEADVVVEKSLPQAVAIGRPFTYRIVLHNRGAADATNVELADAVPEGVRDLMTHPAARFEDGRLLWTIDRIASGERREVRVRFVPTRVGVIETTARVRFGASTEATSRIGKPRVAVRVVVPKPTVVGETARLLVHVANHGPTALADVRVRVLLSESLEHPRGHDVECRIAELAPGAKRVLPLRVRATEIGPFTCRAIAHVGEWSTDATAEAVAVGQRVSLWTGEPRVAEVGRAVTLERVVENVVSQTVDGVQVVEQLPPGVEVQEVGAGGEFDAATGRVVWQLDGLEPGERRKLGVVLASWSPGRHESRVRVEDPVGVLQQSTQPLEVRGRPNLQIEVTSDVTALVVGQRTKYRVRIVNRGSGTVRGLTFNATSTPEMSFLPSAGDPDANAQSRAVLGPVEIEPGDGVEFELHGLATRPGDARLVVQGNSSIGATGSMRSESQVLILPTLDAMEEISE